MKIVLAGQKRFGRDTLDMVLRDGHEVLAVSCPAREDDPLFVGALNRRLRVIPAGRFTADAMPAGADLIIAAHCHDFISRKARERAELGALGYHPSLLPRHRGRSAIEWCIRMRDPVTGGSCYWLNDVVDGGPIAAKELCHVRPDDTARGLWARELAPMGLRLFAKVLAALARGELPATPQDAALATWEPAIENVPPLWRPDVPRLGSSRYEQTDKL